MKNVMNLIDFDLLNTMVQLVFIESMKNIVIFQVKVLFFTISMMHNSSLGINIDFCKVGYSM